MFGGFDVTGTHVPSVRCGRGVRADRRDAERAVVPPVRVTADHMIATGAAGPDVAVLVDQVVVANVTPASGDRVEVIDRADRRGDVRPAVIARGVMHDRLLHALVLGRPLHERFVGGPVLTRERLGRSGRCGRVAVAERRDGGAHVVEQHHEGALVEVAHVHEREAHARKRAPVTREPRAVLREARTGDGGEWPGIVLVAIEVAHVELIVQRRPIAPGSPVRRGAQVHRDGVGHAGRLGPVDPDLIEQLARADRGRGVGRATSRSEREPRGEAWVERGGAGIDRRLRDRDLIGDDVSRATGHRRSRRGRRRVREDAEREEGDQGHEAQTASHRRGPLFLSRHRPHARMAILTHNGGRVYGKRAQWAPRYRHQPREVLVTGPIKTDSA